MSRSDACKAYKKHVKTEAMRDTVMASMIAQRPYQLSKEPDLRPHGATWLNGNRWNDEPEMPSNGVPKVQARRAVDFI